jgi:hypothetical protein
MLSKNKFSQSSLVICQLMLLLFSTSCFREELPIPAHNSGDVQIGSINMGKNYEYQVYFDLETQKETGRNLKSAWDLYFYMSDQNLIVGLNSAKVMYAYPTNKLSFDEVLDTIGFTSIQLWDFPSGDPDSLALKDWGTDKQIYLIDRGIDDKGQAVGFYKIQYISLDSPTFKIRIGKLEDRVGQEFIYNIDQDLFKYYLNLTSANIFTEIEPANDSWDIKFSQYIYVFQNPIMPYLVTGCLINTFHTQACEIKGKTFEEINYEDAKLAFYAKNLDAIGYSWKEYSFDTGSYIVYPEKCYLIQTREGFYYKLHFVDFYDSTGQKGNPVWEYQKL